MKIIFNFNNFLAISEKMFQENNKYPIRLEDVADEMKLSITTLRKYLRLENKIHPNSIPDYFYSLQYKLHNFDFLTLESSYWLGYLFADGCYTFDHTKKGTRLMLECQIADKEILEKFCDFLNIRYSRITIGHKGQSVALCLADSNFSTSVSKWGVCMNKSHTENHVPQDILNNDKLFFQFLRGIIDGDGTIHTYKQSPGISFVSNSELFCQEIKEKLQNVLPMPSSVWVSKKEKEAMKKATQPLYSLKIGTGGLRKHINNNIDFLFHNMYEGQKIILTRKYEAFQKLRMR